ncbi:eCIS core domain-containing protein [Terrimonas sp.]|uniref:eCIS core domain-containing protein n=1 Tax=Terrimonas sp. TaxID=1914338 RepID=UPI00197DBAF3|nr:DUF4157 domain-containing protein [Terrimonas sp.]
MNISKKEDRNLIFFQPKFTINQPGDKYEQEADTVAEQVMRTPGENKQMFFQPQITPINTIQKKCAHCEEEENKVQMKSNGAVAIEAPAIVHDTIKNTGNPLDAVTKNFMESRFGYDFSDVHIHNDTLAHQSSSAINAKAYTSGNHIVFGAEQYQPGTNAGKQLLAHELTHVVQQNNISRQVQRVPCSGYSFKTLTYASVANEHDFAALDGYTPLKGRAYDILSDGKKYFFCFNNQKIFVKYIDTKLVPDLKNQLEANYKIKIEKGGKNWSDADLILLNEAFSMLTTSETALIENYRFIREKQSAVVDGDVICGLHSVDIIKRDYTIQIADACIKDPLGKEKTKFGIDYGVFNILHEIGHAIEYGRLRLATEKYYDAKKALEKFREQFDRASSANQKSMTKQLGSLKTTMDNAFDELDRALDKSTLDQFSKFIKGKRALTDYSKKNATEAFAEAFAIFKANPKKLEKDNKKLFDWFFNAGFS